VARDWSDLFVVAGAPADGSEQEPETDGAERRRGMFSRLRENLRKTRQALGAEIQATLFEEVNEETWERLEEALIYADVGAATTARSSGSSNARRPTAASQAAKSSARGLTSCWPRSPASGMTTST